MGELFLLYNIIRKLLYIINPVIRIWLLYIIVSLKKRKIKKKYFKSLLDCINNSNSIIKRIIFIININYYKVEKLLFEDEN